MLEDTIAVHDGYGGSVRLERLVQLEDGYRVVVIPSDLEGSDGEPWPLDADQLDALAAACHAAADRLRAERRP